MPQPTKRRQEKDTKGRKKARKKENKERHDHNSNTKIKSNKKRWNKLGPLAEWGWTQSSRRLRDWKQRYWISLLPHVLLLLLLLTIYITCKVFFFFGGFFPSYFYIYLIYSIFFFSLRRIRTSSEWWDILARSVKLIFPVVVWRLLVFTLWRRLIAW